MTTRKRVELDQQQIAEIRAAFIAGETARSLSERYGCSMSSVWNYVAGARRRVAARPEPPQIASPRAVDEPRWDDFAACRGVDVNVFFPNPRDRAAISAAKAYCQRCPVVDPCRVFAEVTGSRGIFGGRAIALSDSGRVEDDAA